MLCHHHTGFLYEFEIYTEHRTRAPQRIVKGERMVGFACSERASCAMSVDKETALQPAVAGSFYPDQPAALAQQVDDYIRGAHPYDLTPKAVISPHAGYVFSGPVAASNFRLLHVRNISRVVLIGPTHHFDFTGLAVPTASHMITPLGSVPIDRAAVARLAGLPDILHTNQPFVSEHSLDTQIPFLQRVLTDFSVVPILTGRSDALLAGEVLSRLWGGAETLILVSSDLSHYLSYPACQQLDGETSTAITLLRGDVVDSKRACGHVSVNALLQRARELAMRVTPLDIRNSGDTQGGKDRVVGYGAYCFEEESEAKLGAEDRNTLLRGAGQSISVRARTGNDPRLDPEQFPVPLRALRNVFVTVTLDEKLRGCIGSMSPHQTLIGDVVTNACKAGFSDPRFAPLTPEEANRVHVSVSILGPMRALAADSEHQLLNALQPDRDGLLIQAGDKGATFLPHVWHGLPDPVQFLRHLKAKAGIDSEHWPAEMRAWRYRTEEFSAPISELNGR